MAGNERSGNYKVGRPHLINASGNETPLALRGISRSTAENVVIPQYNAEASYNEYSNHKASGHLNELHQALDMLHESSGGSRSALVLKSRVGELADARNKHGFTLHEDITNGVKEIADRLSTMDVASLPDHAKEHHTAALEAANNFLRTAEPAHLSEFKEFGSDPNKVSVMVEPEYRANIFDYRHASSEEAPVKKTEPLSTVATIMPSGEVKESTRRRQSWIDMMKATPDGKYALRAQGKMPDYEASRTPEQKAAKAAARKARNAAKKAGQ